MTGLEIILSVSCLIFIMTAVIMTVIVKRSIERIQFLETIFTRMFGEFAIFTQFCERVLNRPSYANEPVIVSMLEQLKSLHTHLLEVEDFYTFDLELNDDNIGLEKTDEHEQTEGDRTI